jgi:hypothetical protein
LNKLKKHPKLNQNEVTFDDPIPKEDVKPIEELTTTTTTI